MPDERLRAERETPSQTKEIYLCCPHCWGLNDFGQIDFSRPCNEEPQRQFAVLPLDFLLCPSSSFQPEQGTFSIEHTINRAKLTKDVPASYVGIAGVGKDAASFAATDPRAGIFGYGRTFTAADIKDETARSLERLVTTQHSRQASGPEAINASPVTRRRSKL